MALLRKRDWTAGALRRLRAVAAIATDVVHDRRRNRLLNAFRASLAYAGVPRQRVLAVGVQSAKRGRSLDGIFARMGSERHDVAFETIDVGGRSKLANTNILLARHDLATFDWVVMADDDVRLPDRFTDDFLAIVTLADLRIAGPAHRRHSFVSYPETHRYPDSLARLTNFVEVGPVVALHRSTFDALLPLPDLRYGWGVDLLWPKIARERDWRIGIVDGTPLRHIAPAGTLYSFKAALAEMAAFKQQHDLPPESDAIRTLGTIRGFDDAGKAC